MAVNPWLDLGFRLDIHDLDTLNRSSVIKTWLTRISYNLGIYERSKVALGTMAVDTNMQSERRTFDISSLKPFFLSISSQSSHASDTTHFRPLSRMEVVLGCSVLREGDRYHFRKGAIYIGIEW